MLSLSFLARSLDSDGAQRRMMEVLGRGILFVSQPSLRENCCGLRTRRAGRAIAFVFLSASPAQRGKKGRECVRVT